MSIEKRKFVCGIFVVAVIFVLGLLYIDKIIGTNIGGAMNEIICAADNLQSLQTNEEKEAELNRLMKKLVHYHTEIRLVTSKFPYKGYYIQELVFFLQDIRSELPTEEAAKIVVEMADYIEETGIIDIISKERYIYLLDPLGARTKLESILGIYNSKFILAE